MPHSSHSQPAEEAKVIEERKFWCAMVSACELLLSLLLVSCGGGHALVSCFLLTGEGDNKSREGAGRGTGELWRWRAGGGNCGESLSMTPINNY